MSNVTSRSCADAVCERNTSEFSAIGRQQSRRRPRWQKSKKDYLPCDNKNKANALEGCTAEKRSRESSHSQRETRETHSTRQYNNGAGGRTINGGGRCCKLALFMTTCASDGDDDAPIRSGSIGIRYIYIRAAPMSSAIRSNPIVSFVSKELCISRRLFARTLELSDLMIFSPPAAAELLGRKNNCLLRCGTRNIK